MLRMKPLEAWDLDANGRRIFLEQQHRERSEKNGRRSVQRPKVSYL